MSMFYCTTCDRICDSDDGAEEDSKGKLVCVDCAEDLAPSEDELRKTEGTFGV